MELTILKLLMLLDSNFWDWNFNVECTKVDVGVVTYEIWAAQHFLWIVNFQTEPHIKILIFLQLFKDYDMHICKIQNSYPQFIF